MSRTGAIFISLLLLFTLPVHGQLSISLSTDKSIYAPSDSIHVTITARNGGPAPDTLNFSTSCQASYRIDTLNNREHDSLILICMPAFTERIIPPYDSTQWTFCDFKGARFGPGAHSVVGSVGYLPTGWQSDTLWISVDTLTAGVGIGRPLPSALTLRQNYPNPFNPITTIEFTLLTASHARLEILNLLGETIATIADGDFQPGAHRVFWNGAGLPGTVYFYRLRAGTTEATRKLLLLR